jgi:hypothetical protein
VGIVRSSPGLMARPGKSIAQQSEGRAGEKYMPVGGRVKKLRAVEDQSDSIPKERTSKLGKINLWSLLRPCPRNGASQGKESVLADSGWEGDITARVGRVRRTVILSILHGPLPLFKTCRPSRNHPDDPCSLCSVHSMKLRLAPVDSEGLVNLLCECRLACGTFWYDDLYVI